MSRDFIRLGDPTSHGGKVLAASGRMTVGGIPVALMGDPCSCPIKGHSGCTVAEGDPTLTLDGVPVALVGHKTTCGAQLLSAAPGLCQA
nr:PAAR domain-containing protein [uncultured Holophaga sp.]